MSRPRSKRRRKVLLGLKIAAYLLFLYLATYLLMMELRWPAFDMTKGNWCEQSAYRFAPCRTFPLIGPTWLTCWANDIFWPADWALKPVTKPYRDAYFPEFGPLYSDE